jgi:hypothetical protein
MIDESKVRDGIGAQKSPTEFALLWSSVAQKSPTYFCATDVDLSQLSMAVAGGFFAGSIDFRTWVFASLKFFIFTRGVIRT